ncbi:MAG: glycosyltransferase [Tannerellaceae bacterium]|nr:glycosyltransferase [Tannerellaceae bacterium]
MKILLVTRGAQGNIYPFLTIATELKRRGHEVVLNLPRIFEELAKSLDIEYIVQDEENTEEITEQTARSRNRFYYLLNRMKKTIDNQFEQLIPVAEQFDLIIAGNTEFAAPSIAEYCNKPLIRTTFAPFIPGKNIPPPVFRFPESNPFITPALLWKVLNGITNLTVNKTINRKRKALGMDPIRNFGKHSVENSKNYLLYSRYLGTTDIEWKIDWKIGGYCFNDQL